MSIGLNRNPYFLISISKKLISPSIRCLATHWDPKFKKLRANKFIKVRFTQEEKGNDKKRMKIKKTLKFFKVIFIEHIKLQPPLLSQNFLLNSQEFMFNRNKIL